jgi:peptide deformylase
LNKGEASSNGIRESVTRRFIKAPRQRPRWITPEPVIGQRFARTRWANNPPYEPIMSIRAIVRYPDRRLAIPARPVTVFDGALRELAKDLLETMHAAPGIGITAPHIGVLLRVVVLDLNPTDGARTYVNPEIEWASSETIPHREGSVSMPGVNDDVMRHARIRISYQDVDGNLQTEESDGLRAVCHQHEIDQLNGMFWINRLSRLKRERLIKRFEKMSRRP